MVRNECGDWFFHWYVLLMASHAPTAIRIQWRQVVGYLSIQVAALVWVLLLTLVLLVAKLVNMKWWQKAGEWLKPWHMATHLRVLSQSYPMNTNMTCFGWFSKFLALLCVMDECYLSIRRVYPFMPVPFNLPDYFGGISLPKAIFWKYLMEKFSSELYLQLSFKYFSILCLILKLSLNAWQVQTILIK